MILLPHLKTNNPPIQVQLSSEHFPGLWLAQSALLTEDLAQVLATLQEGLNSTEHQNLVKKMTENSN